MDQYHLGHNRMPIRLRFAFFMFHVRNVYFMWYYNRRNGRHVHQQLTPGRGRMGGLGESGDGATLRAPRSGAPGALCGASLFVAGRGAVGFTAQIRHCLKISRARPAASP
jgi:hypothetical protein